MIKKCEVCSEVDHKYRCPQCRLVYCSVACFKTHKETSRCIQEGDHESSSGPSLMAEDLVPVSPVEFELTGNESEDRVSLEQLAKLEDSKVLKDMLSNPHLRTIITSLVQTQKPGDQLASAMQEPIFTEFADRCLTVIGGQEQEEDYISD